MHSKKNHQSMVSSSPLLSSSSSTLFLARRRIIDESWYHSYIIITKTIVVGIGIMICIILHIQQQKEPRQQPTTLPPVSTSPPSKSNPIFNILDIYQSVSSLSPLPSPSPSSIRHHRAHVRSSNSNTSSASMTVTMNHLNDTIIGIDDLSQSLRTNNATIIMEGQGDVINSRIKRNRMMKETTSFFTVLWDRLRSILSYLFPNRQAINNVLPATTTKIILDSIASARDSKFNNKLYDAMELCMNTTYISILITNSTSTNNSISSIIPYMKLTHDIWLKLIQYAIKINNTNDPWGDGTGSRGNWFEWNPTNVTVNLTTATNNISTNTNININTIFQFPIMEPCNTLSNYAFYRSMVIVYHLNNIHDNSIMNVNYNNNNISSISSISSSSSTSSWSIVPNQYRIGFINTFGLLSWGSAFYHASSTNVGGINDEIFISILAYTAYQMMFDNLIPYNPLLHELITNPNYTTSNDTNNNNNNNNNRISRSKALDALTRMNTILYTKPIEEWAKAIKIVYNDIPFYTLTFSAIITTVANLSFPKTIAYQISKFLNRLVVTDITQLEYLDTIFPLLFRNSITEETLNQIRFRDRIQLIIRVAGVLTKIIWGFLWQEEIIPGPHLRSIILNRLAATMTPIINQLSNALTGYDRTSYYFDREFQRSNNVYPDNLRCNGLQPHSKWHESAANGLIDLLLFCADTKKIIDGGTLIVNANDYDDVEIIHQNVSKLNSHETVSNVVDHDIECDENMNFLHCALKYGMSSFDLMDNITNINTDPTVVAITNCFHYVLDSITNSSDGRYFSNCLMNQFVASSTSSSMSKITSLIETLPSSSSTTTMTIGTSNVENLNNEMTTQQTTKSREVQNLDSCLFQNDCIAFNGIWTINIKQLTNCIQSSSTNHGVHASCQTYVTEPEKLEQCWYTCKFDDNFNCVNECILRFNKQVSPSYKQMISCMLLLANPDRHDRSNLEGMCFVSTLLRQSSSSLLTFNNVFIHGLEKLTKCSLMGPCRKSYNQFINAIDGIQECSSKCYSDRSNNPLRFLKLPTGVSCWLGCYVKQSK